MAAILLIQENKKHVSDTHVKPLARQIDDLKVQKIRDMLNRQVDEETVNGVFFKLNKKVKKYNIEDQCRLVEQILGECLIPEKQVLAREIIASLLKAKYETDEYNLIVKRVNLT